MTMHAPPSAPLPVQPLAYPDSTDPGYSRVVLAAAGVVMLAFGALMALAHAWTALSEATGWGQPLRVASPRMVVAISAVQAAAGAMQAVGGAGCLGRPRRWARPLLLASGVLGCLVYAAWVSLTVWNTPFVFGQFSTLLPYLGNVVSLAGFPALTVVIASARRLWPE